MKILIFNWRCWLNPDAGGAEVFTKEVATRWVRARNHVTLFASEFQGCKREEAIDGARIIRAGGKYSVYKEAKKYYAKMFSKDHFDVVIDEINTRPFMTPKFVKRGESIVALIHQLAREYWFYETKFPVNYLGYHFLEKRWLKNYLDIPTITVSESTKWDLRKLGFKNVHVVPEGLNFQPLDKVPEKESHPVIAYVGRLKKAKRPDHAVKAFRFLKEKVPESELWIIGNGYFRKDLEKSAVSGIEFFRGLDDSKRRELISRAWVLVNPSVREGWGLNVIEANALGTPAIAYDVPGLRESVVDSRTGLLAKAGDIDDLTAKILCVLRNNSLRQRLASEALEFSRVFSWDKTASEFMKNLEQITSGR